MPEKSPLSDAMLSLAREHGINAGRSIFLLNGSAAVSLITIIDKYPSLISSILYFGAGAAFATIIFAFGYICQSYYNGEIIYSHEAERHRTMLAQNKKPDYIAAGQWPEYSQKLPSYIQECEKESRKKRTRGIIFNYLALFLFFAALGVFTKGGYEAFSAVSASVASPLGQ